MKFFPILTTLGIFAVTILSGTSMTASADPETAPAKRLPVLWLIGDSTVRNGTKGQMGWGDPLKDWFDPAKISVENRARGGRSSRTYFTEGLWDAVLKDMQPGDFVLMQFGHNDGGSLTGPKATGRASIKGNGEETSEVISAEGKTEVVHTYGWYLRRYISDAKSKGAYPIVLSMIPRNDWTNGKVNRAFPGYGQSAKEAAEQEKVPFINLNEIVALHYEELGQEKVAAYFPNEHTHTNEVGARLNAQSVVEGLKSQPELPLNGFLKANAPTHP